MDKNKRYLTVYKAIGGWQVAMYAWYEDDEMWDVAQTGFGPYKNRETAVQEAKIWAQNEDDVEYKYAN